MSRALRPMLVMLLVGGLLAPGGTPEDAAATPVDPRPNVIIVLTDDQPMGALQVMPKLRKWMVRRGRRFPNAHVTTPLCCPSRATIFTGRYAHNHGIESNHVVHSRFDQSTGVQRALREAGYRTGIFGKYFNGWDLQTPPPHFDDWAIFGSHAHRWSTTWNQRGEVRAIPTYSTKHIERRALRFLAESETDDAQPWFMQLSPLAPHEPLLPAARYRKAKIPPWRPNPSVREEHRSDKPPWVRTGRASVRGVRAERAKMLRTLMSVDDMVDAVIRRVQKLGEGERTLIFFLSDNGWLWGEHGLRRKRWPYTRSTRVPFLMRWPGHLPGGSVDRRLVTNADIAPTILEVAGVAPDHLVDGRSLVDDSWFRGRLHLEHARTSQYKRKQPPTWASTRTPSFQYIEYFDEAGNMMEREYYDLRDDPWQLVNLLGDASPANDPTPGVLAQLSAQLWRDRRCEGTEGAFACP